MNKPKLFYNNVLRDAQTSDDGTNYATCVTASADANDPFKVLGTISKAADIATLADLVGCRAVFTASGNSYRIVGQGSGYLNLYERLQAVDVGGTFYIRAGLSSNSTATDRPIDFIADGHISPRTKGLASTALYANIHLPNLCKNGGFENGSNDWTVGANWALISIGKLEGYYSIKWDTAANNNISQVITNEIIKGKTYSFLFKAKATTANPTQGVITINLKNSVSATNIYSAISGNNPAITTTATWFTFDFIPDYTTNNWYVEFVTDSTKKGSATEIIIDEIYIWEKKAVNAIIIHSHNMAGATLLDVKALRLSPLRSTYAVDANNYYTLKAGYTVETSDTEIQTFTSYSWPVYRIALTSSTSTAHEVGEIYLGDSWTLPRYPQPMDPYATGDGYLREMRLQFSNLPPAYRKLNIEDLFERLRQNEGIFVQWDTDAPILMEDTDVDKSAAYNPFFVDMTRTFRERL